MAADEIVWEDPPPNEQAPRGRGKWQRILEELKQHPGKWALVGHGVQNPQGWSPVRARLKRDGAEAVTRRKADGLTCLYARWPEAAS